MAVTQEQYKEMCNHMDNIRVMSFMNKGSIGHDSMHEQWVKALNSTIEAQDVTIKKLKEEQLVLYRAYNSLCADISNGEHIDIGWVKDTIASAAHDMMATIYQKKIKSITALMKEACDVMERITVGGASSGQYLETFLNKPEVKDIRSKR